jgi:hypothetical protein
MFVVWTCRHVTVWCWTLGCYLDVLFFVLVFFFNSYTISCRDVFVLRYVFINLSHLVFVRLVCSAYIILRPESSALIMTGPLYKACTQHRNLKRPFHSVSGRHVSNSEFWTKQHDKLCLTVVFSSHNGLHGHSACKLQPIQTFESQMNVNCRWLWCYVVIRRHAPTCGGEALPNANFKKL